MAYLTPEQLAQYAEMQQNGDANSDKNVIPGSQEDPGREPAQQVKPQTTPETQAPQSLATFEPHRTGEGIPDDEGDMPSHIENSAPDVSTPAPEVPAKKTTTWNNLDDMYDDLVKSSDQTEKEREAALNRKQKAHDLAQAIRVGLGGFGNALGGYTAKMEPDTYTPLTRQMVEKLRDQRDLTDRQLKLQKLQAAVRQSLQDQRLGYLTEKEKRDNIKDAYYHSPGYLKEVAKINAWEKAQIENATTQSQIDKIKATGAERMKELIQMGKNTKEAIGVRAAVKPPKTKKPFLTVDIGNGQTQDYTKEKATKEASDWISAARKGAKDGSINEFELPKFIQNIIDNDAPLTDSQVKELVKWRYMKKLGGSGRTFPSGMGYDYSSGSNNANNNAPAAFQRK